MTPPGWFADRPARYSDAKDLILLLLDERNIGQAIQAGGALSLASDPALAAVRLRLASHHPLLWTTNQSNACPEAESADSVAFGYMRLGPRKSTLLLTCHMPTGKSCRFCKQDKRRASRAEAFLRRQNSFASNSPVRDKPSLKPQTLSWPDHRPDTPAVV